MCEFLKKLFGGATPTLERPSPKIRITPDQADLIIRAVKLIPGMEDCYIAAIEPSNSMEPTIDDGLYVVLDSSIEAKELIVGDIIWYETSTFSAIHRIIEIGTDPEWWCRCRGDNNSARDPGKVRAADIKGVWRATLD